MRASRAEGRVPGIIAKRQLFWKLTARPNKPSKRRIRLRILRSSTPLVVRRRRLSAYYRWQMLPWEPKGTPDKILEERALEHMTLRASATTTDNRGERGSP